MSGEMVPPGLRRSAAAAAKEALYTRTAVRELGLKRPSWMQWPMAARTSRKPRKPRVKTTTAGADLEAKLVFGVWEEWGKGAIEGAHHLSRVALKPGAYGMILLTIFRKKMRKKTFFFPVNYLGLSSQIGEHMNWLGFTRSW